MIKKLLFITLLTSALFALDDTVQIAENMTSEGFQQLSQNKLEEAKSSFQKALVYQGSYAKAHLGLGITYFNLHEYKEAIRRLKTAIIFDNELIDSYDYLGRSYELSSEKLKAFETYLKALNIDPLFSKHSARFHKSATLSSGSVVRRQELLKKLQEVKDLTGKRIYIENDTPIIDTLILARFLDLLHQQKAEVYFEPGPKLQNLFTKAMPHIHMVNWLSLEEDIVFDYKISLSSLPLFFNMDPSSIPMAEGYMFYSAPTQTNKIGIAWRFDGEDPQGEHSAISLQKLLQMAAPDKEIYLLQEAPREIPEKVTPASFRGQSLDDISGLISQMDEVIAVDGSIARLAAAMGKKVTIVLPTPCQWLWFLEGNGSPWFKNVELKRIP